MPSHEPDDRGDPDQPQEDGYELVVPFIACQSHGGTFDDNAFVAGFQAGQIDQALHAGATVGAVTLRFPAVRADLVAQLELICMNRGYPVLDVTAIDGYPEWVDLAVHASTPGQTP